MLIAFEGIDGSGKTTQAKMLADYFYDKGLEVVFTREPGGTPVAEKIRKIILENNLDDYTQFYLFQAAREDHVRKLINPAMDNAKIVICDRFITSTRVYQSNISEAHIDLCDKRLECTPHITFLIDIPPSLAQERLKNRQGDLNHFDKKDFSYHKNVRDKFLKIALSKPDSFKIIDGYGTASEVRDRIVSHPTLISYIKNHIRYLESRNFQNSLDI